MTSGQNIIDSSGIGALVQQAGPVVTQAIQKAASATGVDFSYLMKKASVESGFDTDAKSKSSSATGLYQFLDKTWMSMVKKYGDKFGMGNLADKIDSSGHCSDAATKKQILDLRNDPEKSACLAAEYDSENKNYLEQHAGSSGSATDLYLAHFMGAGAASGFLNSMKDNPLQSAATLFPKAAAANHNVFYNSNGGAKSLAQVYSFFSAKFKGESGSMVASASMSNDNQDGVMDAMLNLTASANTGDAQNAILSLGAISPIGGSATRVQSTGAQSTGALSWAKAPQMLSPATALNMHSMHLSMFSKLNPLAMKASHKG